MFIILLILACVIAYRIGHSNGYNEAELMWRTQAGWGYVSDSNRWLRMPPAKYKCPVE